MRRLAIMALLFACAATALAADRFTVLCYHEVRDDVRDYPDPFAVDTSGLVRQFAWLHGNGYIPVSLEDIVRARRGGKPLPDKAVLLTFDDAYLSFYTKVYPLLREFRYPAVLGVVGRWIDEPGAATASSSYGEKATVSEASFPSWAQLREMAASGLVEIASHTYDLHRGIPANPQGNLQPAATARAYDAASGRFEDDAAWLARVRADLARNSSAIERGTGRRPRAIVWPYGSYNGELQRMADELGMPVALTLEDGANTADVPLNALRRVLVEHNPTLVEFALEVRGPLRPLPVRVVQLSLDSIYSVDAARMESNLSALLDRMQALKPTHVVLQATTDTNGDGIPDAAYFPNRYLPLRADLFNRVAWQVGSRVDAKVIATMPSEGFRLSAEDVAGLYQDLARHANFDGLLFTDGSMESTQRLYEGAVRWRAMKIARRYADASIAASDLRSDYVVLPLPPEGAAPSRSPRTLYLLDGAAPARRMRALQLGGALNFGYADDDSPQDRPPLARTAPAMSLREYPLAPERKEK